MQTYREDLRGGENGDSILFGQHLVRQSFGSLVRNHQTRIPDVSGRRGLHRPDIQCKGFRSAEMGQVGMLDMDVRGFGDNAAFQLEARHGFRFRLFGLRSCRLGDLHMDEKTVTAKDFFIESCWNPIGFSSLCDIGIWFRFSGDMGADDNQVPVKFSCYPFY